MVFKDIMTVLLKGRAASSFQVFREILGIALLHMEAYFEMILFSNQR